MYSLDGLNSTLSPVVYGDIALSINTQCNLTLVPSLKVKQWFTGFSELSFRWIQICIGSPMRRSSCISNSFLDK